MADVVASIGQHYAGAAGAYERVMVTKRIAAGLAGILMVALLCGIAWASVKWSKAFNDLYKPAPDSALKKAKCAVCHVDPKGKGKLNAYGKMLEKAKVDPASLKAIEKKDADKDKVSNIAEIKAGTLPADPKSKPGCK